MTVEESAERTIGDLRYLHDTYGLKSDIVEALNVRIEAIAQQEKEKAEERSKKQRASFVDVSTPSTETSLKLRMVDGRVSLLERHTYEQAKCDCESRRCGVCARG